jgi:hypothetical protein
MTARFNSRGRLWLLLGALSVPALASIFPTIPRDIIDFGGGFAFFIGAIILLRKVTMTRQRIVEFAVPLIYLALTGISSAQSYPPYGGWQTDVNRLVQGFTQQIPRMPQGTPGYDNPAYPVPAPYYPAPPRSAARDSNACPPNCGPSNSREGMRYKFDSQGNLVGTDGAGQTDPFYCRNHAKGALDLDNCWRRQHGEKPVNRNDLGKLPEGYIPPPHPATSPSTSQPTQTVIPCPSGYGPGVGGYCYKYSN